MFRLTTRFLVLTGLFVPVLAGFAVDQAPPSQLPSQVKPVEGILVPVPKEIFNVLDEFKDANWRAVQRSEISHWKSHGDQVQVALLLGTVIAEGFVAMEAEDAVEVHKLGQRALSLAGGLGVKRAALKRSSSIMEYADANKWDQTRSEWDGVLSDLEQGMVRLKSEPLAELVSLSGWLRGTDALCALVLQNYSSEHAELIRQPAVVDYLAEQIASMKPEMRKHPMVRKMETGLRNIRELIDPNGTPLTADKVKEIGKICDELVKVSSQRRP